MSIDDPWEPASEDAWIPEPADTSPFADQGSALPTPRPEDSDDHGQSPQPEGEAERTPLFANPEEFVTGFLAPHICRRLGGTATWCSEWYRHTEAISRIVAMWSAFEHLRWEGALGLSTWWLHHADPHLAVLMSKDSGPFMSCKPDRHVDLPPLPCGTAPEGMWDHPAFSG